MSTPLNSRSFQLQLQKKVSQKSSLKCLKTFLLSFDEFFAYLSFHPLFLIADIDYWKKLGFRDIHDALQRYADMRGESIPQAVSKTKFPKNVILFIGDGMSIATVTGARIHKGQKLFKQSGEEQFLSWERFPASALMKVNMQFDFDPGVWAVWALAKYFLLSNLLKISMLFLSK